MTDPSSTNQRAGSNSEQTAAGRDAVHAGGNITIVNINQGKEYLETSRDRVIAREYSNLGDEAAVRRVSVFDENFLRGVSELGRLSVLADPGYQRTLNDARLSAAATGRPADAERLVILMKERAISDGQMLRAAVARAVQIIDNVDEGALQALLCYSMGGAFIPTDTNPDRLLETWAGQLRRLGFEETTQHVPGWLEHLHGIGAVRLDTPGVRSYKPFTSWIKDTRPAFFAPGAEKELFDSLMRESSEDYTVPAVKHEFKENAYRLLFTKKDELVQYIGSQEHSPGLNLDETAERLMEMFQVNIEDATTVHNFSALLKKHPLVLHYGEWRTSVENTMSITHVGYALLWAAMKNLGFEMPSLEHWIG